MEMEFAFAFAIACCNLGDVVAAVGKSVLVLLLLLLGVVFAERLAKESRMKIEFGF